MFKDLYDRMSLTYDADVIDCDDQNRFPFAGYQKTLNLIAEDINRRRDFSSITVLDLGIGTGILASKLFPERMTLFGIDSSKAMLEIASLKLPSGKFYLHDFRAGLPQELSNERFDYIVSTYVMHRLTSEEFINYLDYLIEKLNPFGRIYIGDIMFLNARERENCRLGNLEDWDETAFYHDFDNIVNKLKKKISMNYLKMSFCAGILILENYHEHTLQNCESLVKY
jgi:putative AdoMet-dependent methyltransferase